MNLVLPNLGLSDFLLTNRSQGCQRLSEELKKLLPIAGDPFDRQGNDWKPAFQIVLPVEHLRRIRKTTENEEEQGGI